jgi:hypothetical protein
VAYLDLAKDIEVRLATGGPPPTRELRVGDPGFAHAVTTSVWTPLDGREDAGVLLEVRVPWWPDTLWFVPVARDADRLSADGVARHRVWTFRELVSFLEGFPLDPTSLSALMVVRREFNGEVVGLIQRSVSVPDGSG